MFAVIVTFRIRTGKMDQFMPLMLENARASVADEPDCHQFDVCSDEDHPDEVFLYEIYGSAEAFKAHLASEHFVNFDRETADMILTKEARTYGKVG